MDSSKFTKFDTKTDPSPLEAVFFERPDLRDKANFSPEQGSSAHTIIFEDEVFKVAKQTAHDPSSFEQEIKIMKHLEGRGLPVPQLTTVREDDALFGMTKTKGVSLSAEMLQTMTSGEQQQVAKEIAGFISGMASSFTDKDITDMGPQLKQPTDTWGKAADPAKTLESLSHPRMQENLAGQKDYVGGLVQKHLDERATKKKMVMHMDMNSGNIFIDPQTKKLSGIIDFGLVGLVAPEEGFVNMAKVYPKPFVEMVCKEYSEQTGQEVAYKDVIVAGLARDIESATRVYAGQQGGTAAPESLHTYVNIWIDKLQTAPPRVKNHNIFKP